MVYFESEKDKQNTRLHKSVKADYAYTCAWLQRSIMLEQLVHRNDFTLCVCCATLSRDLIGQGQGAIAITG